jgi:hypothetical protein
MSNVSYPRCGMLWRSNAYFKMDLNPRRRHLFLLPVVQRISPSARIFKSQRRRTAVPHIILCDLVEPSPYHLSYENDFTASPTV